MITIHIEGTVIGHTFQESYYDVKSFDFDGKDDAKTEQDIRNTYFNMKKRGLVNVCIVTEDSQVPEDSATPELRWGKPYMLGNSGYPKPFVMDTSCEEIERYWN